MSAPKAPRAAAKTYPVRRPDGIVVRVTVPEDDCRMCGGEVPSGGICPRCHPTKETSR